mgnify:CR=1 FL=1
MNETVKKYAFWGILGVLALFLFYLLSGGGLSNESVRAYRVGEHLERIGDNQQSAIKRLDHIEAESSEIQRELGETAEQVGNVENRIEEHQNRLGESQRLIGRGKEIIQGIRKRGTIQTKEIDPTTE